MMISVALCTFNRAALLRDALESLSMAKPPTSEWELLLVDNNSTDSTRKVAETFCELLPMRYLFEPNQGLALARNRALRECRGDVLLFTDDDLRFDPDWLCNYEAAMVAAPHATWFGGRIRPLWPNGPPSWLRDEGMALISGLMVRYDLGAQDRFYAADDPSPFGASFALRRQAFEAMGEFRADLGVRGNVPGRGEEAEYFIRLRRAAMPGYYVGSSSAWHWQDPARFRWRYLYRFGVQKGIAEARIEGLDGGVRGSRLREVGFGFKAAIQLLKGRGDRARQCVINMGIERGLRGQWIASERGR